MSLESAPSSPALTSLPASQEIEVAEFWDSHSVDVNGTLTFSLGPMTLTATRFEREWRFSWWHDNPPLSDRVRFSDGGGQVVAVPDNATHARFAFETAPKKITLVPVLADRMMVARPDVSLTLPPQESVRLYLSTPLWLRVVVEGDAGERMLWEEATVRPSDTWFGDKPTEGEMAYASLTNARLALDEVAWLHQRVVTEVEVVNASPVELKLPRLSIPVRLLSVHLDESGRLWSPGVRLSRTSDGPLANLEVTALPSAAGPCRKLGESRDPPQTRNAVRAFAKLFAG